MSGAIVLTLLAILGLAVAKRCAAKPSFSGFSPMSITMVAEQPDGQNFYKTTSTDRRACSNIVRLLAEAHLTDFHACPHRGWLEIRYERGPPDTFYFLPGHDLLRYEIRCEGGNFSLSRERFFQVLKEAAFDVSRITYDEN